MYTNTILPWLDKIPPNDKTYFYEKDLIELDAEYEKQVELQYNEDIKIAEVKQGYVELNKELDIKVTPIQKIVEKIKKPIATIENKTHNATTKVQQVFNKTGKTIQNTTKIEKDKIKEKFTSKLIERTHKKQQKTNKRKSSHTSIKRNTWSTKKWLLKINKAMGWILYKTITWS